VKELPVRALLCEFLLGIPPAFLSLAITDVFLFMFLTDFLERRVPYLIRAVDEKVILLFCAFDRTNVTSPDSGVLTRRRKLDKGTNTVSLELSFSFSFLHASVVGIVISRIR
jgi:hypothetical protein